MVEVTDYRRPHSYPRFELPFYDALALIHENAPILWDRHLGHLSIRPRKVFLAYGGRGEVLLDDENPTFFRYYARARWWVEITTFVDNNHLMNLCENFERERLLLPSPTTCPP